jgi:AraC family transcriptional regulator of adaptative response/methylated-DNA-[protein]-cysteine methyltransferase
MQAETFPFDSDDARWDAVAARDATADGRFVFAVTSTGVYCRPGCPARRPKRANVAFYPDGPAARAAGFRPCKRCEPDAAPERRLLAQAVTAAAALIEAAVGRGDPAPALAALAKRAGYAPHHFHRMFRRATGLTPRGYAAALRARRAETALAGGASVTEAAMEAGYGAASRFYAGAGPRLGMAPSARRDGGRGETIRYAIVPTTLGPALAAATDRGLCALQFDADAGWLARRYPAARIEPGGPAFAATAAAAAALVEAAGADPGLPLDLRGAAFQERVWQALRAIPAGSTASYAEVAEAIGAPRAARAVAAACAANPLAVVVPCHRVVRADGDLSGYRWGPARKAALLAREGVAVLGKKVSRPAPAAQLSTESGLDAPDQSA